MKIEFGGLQSNCEGVSRRSFLKVGTLAALGISLPELSREVVARGGPAGELLSLDDGDDRAHPGRRVTA